MAAIFPPNHTSQQAIFQNYLISNNHHKANKVHEEAWFGLIFKKNPPFFFFFEMPYISLTSHYALHPQELLVKDTIMETLRGSDNTPLGAVGEVDLLHQKIMMFEQEVCFCVRGDIF